MSFVIFFHGIYRPSFPHFFLGFSLLKNRTTEEYVMSAPKGGIFYGHDSVFFLGPYHSLINNRAKWGAEGLHSFWDREREKQFESSLRSPAHRSPEWRPSAKDPPALRPLAPMVTASLARDRAGGVFVLDSWSGLGRPTSFLPWVHVFYL